MFGGPSEERFVSVASAQNLARTMHEKSSLPFNELWFVSPNGDVVNVPLKTLIEHENPFKAPFTPKNSQSIAPDVTTAISKIRSQTDAEPLVFLGFHGTFGEDGKVQALLEKNKIPFTGSGSAASHRCFDKTLTKTILRDGGLTTAPGRLLESSSGSNQLASDLQAFFKEHKKIVVKPVANGSSIGLHIISDDSGLERALLEIGKASSYGPFMTEKFISGRELTVGVIEHKGKLVSLPPSEVILNQGGSFDYEGKYLGRGTTEITPAQLTADETSKAKAAALHAHQTLGCYGYSRTDMILNSDGLTMIETNTLPGLTRASFIPQQLESAGLTVAEFVEDQMTLALKR